MKDTPYVMNCIVLVSPLHDAQYLRTYKFVDLFSFNLHTW